MTLAYELKRRGGATGYAVSVRAMPKGMLCLSVSIPIKVKMENTWSKGIKIR